MAIANIIMFDKTVHVSCIAVAFGKETDMVAEILLFYHMSEDLDIGEFFEIK